MYRPHVLACDGTGCTSSGSPKIVEALQNGTKRQGLEEEVVAAKAGYHGLCTLGPTMTVYPNATFYPTVQSEDIPEIVAEHPLKGCVIIHLLYQETISSSSGIKTLSDIDFHKKQHRIALCNCGVINPENIEEYIGTGGYQAPDKILIEMTPDGVIQTLLDAGLCGRGDAGFPTGLKWKLCKRNDTDQKCVCCNVDEGDPGAFMGRPVLEGDPHTLLEAMVIAGCVIRSNQGYIYVRTEYPIAVEHLKIAVSRARKMGLLGKDIFGTGLGLDVDTRLGVGAFVCGEEIALMISIEGKRGKPGPRLPFPVQKGLFSRPGILNNVETYTSIPQIILNGPGRFVSTDTEKLKGTGVFTLDGKINSTGLTGVPIRTTLYTVINEIGGGTSNGKEFKAAQAGRSSGGCILVEHFDTPIDYDNLLSTGSMMGSDRLIVMDRDDCMADIVKFFLEPTVEESCGKCTTCHIDTKRMLEIPEKVAKGTAEIIDLDKLEELYHYVKANSLCGLGQTVPNLVLPTFHFFRDEYEAHTREKHYSVGVYKALLSYVIDYDKCRGCTLYVRTYPIGVAIGSAKNPHAIDFSKCIKCGACMERRKLDVIYKK